MTFHLGPYRGVICRECLQLEYHRIPGWRWTWWTPNRQHLYGQITRRRWG